MSRAAMQQALEALKDALSVCRSVSTCKTRRTREDGVTMYAQTEEWCRWVEDEVGPKVDAAGDALIAALAEQKCPCGDRPADQCPGEWEPGCDLGANEKYAKVAEQPQPLTIERLRDALVASRIIDPGAVEDSDDYDDGLTLHRIEALFRRLG